MPTTIPDEAAEKMRRALQAVELTDTCVHWQCGAPIGICHVEGGYPHWVDANGHVASEYPTYHTHRNV